MSAALVCFRTLGLSSEITFWPSYAAAVEVVRGAAGRCSPECENSHCIVTNERGRVRVLHPPKEKR